jgi:hypothetical protein
MDSENSPLLDRTKIADQRKEIIVSFGAVMRPRFAPSAGRYSNIRMSQMTVFDNSLTADRRHVRLHRYGKFELQQ